MTEKTQPFDLDAYVDEAEDKRPDFEFIFGGEKYTLPLKPDFFAILDLEHQNFKSGLMRLLGGEQWARMVASDAVMDTGRLNALLEAYQKHLGVKPGESLASPASSKKTATRSRRISNGTTKLR